MLDYLPQDGGGHELVRVHEAALGLVRLRLGLLDRLHKLDVAVDAEVARKVVDEAGGDDGAVGVLDARARDDVGDVAVPGREESQRWGEEEKRDPPGAVVADDLGEDGERRIVHDHAVRGIVGGLVVGAGPEGADDLAALQVGESPHEGEHGVVDRLRGVAVVGGLLRDELVHEGVVVVELLAVCHVSSLCGRRSLP